MSSIPLSSYLSAAANVATAALTGKMQGQAALAQQQQQEAQEKAQEELRQQTLKLNQERLRDLQEREKERQQPKEETQAQKDRLALADLTERARGYQAVLQNPNSTPEAVNAATRGLQETDAAWRTIFSRVSPNVGLGAPETDPAPVAPAPAAPTLTMPSLQPSIGIQKAPPAPPPLPPPAAAPPAVAPAAGGAFSVVRPGRTLPRPVANPAVKQIQTLQSNLRAYRGNPLAAELIANPPDPNDPQAVAEYEKKAQKVLAGPTTAANLRARTAALARYTESGRRALKAAGTPNEKTWERVLHNAQLAAKAAGDNVDQVTAYLQAARQEALAKQARQAEGDRERHQKLLDSEAKAKAAAERAKAAAVARDRAYWEKVREYEEKKKQSETHFQTMRSDRAKRAAAKAGIVKFAPTEAKAVRDLDGALKANSPMVKGLYGGMAPNPKFDPARAQQDFSRMWQIYKQRGYDPTPLLDKYKAWAVSPPARPKPTATAQTVPQETLPAARRPVAQGTPQTAPQRPPAAAAGQQVLPPVPPPQGVNPRSWEKARSLPNPFPKESQDWYVWHTFLGLGATTNEILNATPVADRPAVASTLTRIKKNYLGLYGGPQKSAQGPPAAAPPARNLNPGVQFAQNAQGRGWEGLAFPRDVTRVWGTGANQGIMRRGDGDSHNFEVRNGRIVDLGLTRPRQPTASNPFGGTFAPFGGH